MKYIKFLTDFHDYILNIITQKYDIFKLYNK